MTSLISRISSMMVVATLVVTGACAEKNETTPAEQPARPARSETVAGTVVGWSGLDEGRPDAVKIKPSPENRWRPAASGEALHSGDSVLVEADGAVMLRLSGGGRLSLNAGTIMKILSPSSVEVTFGELWIENGILDPASPLLIKTKRAETSLLGASAGIRVAETSVTASLVSGSAVLRGSFGELAVREGQEAVVDDQGARRVHIADPSGLVSWTKGLQKALAPSRGGEGLAGLPRPSGLGTLTAKPPGGGAPLPFRILAEDVTVRVQDHVALTRVEQVFQNPTGQVVEGTYKFPLPSGARLNRYDMEINGKMRQGEIVERERGRRIMKTVIREFVDRMRDPALVEWESGSTFKTRIFPIQPREEKRIVLSYIQTLAGAGGRYRYVLPVSPAGGEAPRVPRFRLRAEVGSSGGVPRITSPLYPAKTGVDGNTATLDFSADNFEPKVDFALLIDQPVRKEASLATYGEADNTAGARAALHDDLPSGTPLQRKDDYFMLRLSPDLEEMAARDPEGSDWILMADTSKSRTAVDAEIQKRLIDALIGVMGARDRVKVVAFDMFQRVMSGGEWEAPSDDLPERARAFLDGIPPDGATNLAGALRVAAMSLDPSRPAKVILIGDGAATLGENRPGPLSDLAANLLRTAPVTTVGVGSSVDTVLFEALAQKTGGKHFSVSSGEDLLAAAVRIVSGLRTAMLERPAIAFEGLQVFDVGPEPLANLASGEDVVITGRYRGQGELTATLTGTLGGTPWQKSFTFDVGKARSANAFIPLLWASRRIDLLALRDDEASIRETVSLSKRFSIPSRYTSFIVLENQAMHREFNVAETDDRIEWTGEDEVEYEASDEAPVQEIAAPGGIGGGRGEELRMAAGAGGAADRSRAVMSGAPVSPPRSAPMPKASSEAGASKKRKAAEKPALGMVDDDLFGGGSIGYPRPCPRRYSYDVRVWRIPDRARDKDQAEAAALRAKIERDPLSRKLRRDLVRHLIRFGQYREALTEAARWLEMDSANPAAVTYAADMMRLGGNLFDALRMYSGVLDLKPEARGIMEMLAAYFESHGLWKEAYPFRVSLSLTRQADFNAAAAMAVAAERAGYGAEALAAAGALTTRNATGRIALAKGVRLKKALKDAVVAMVSEGRLPIPPGGAADAEARNAKLRIEARWNTSQNLDLWVSKRGEKFLGGSDSKARLVPGGSGTEGEVFYMATADPGKYTVQVVCAESGGCDGASGTLEIRVHGTRRTIPFDLPDGLGTDVAIITVERRRAACW